MGVPKKKTSRSKKRMRQAQQKVIAPTIAVCPQCNAPKPAHFACPECGYYKGGTVRQAQKNTKET